jgi:cytochrome c oxidase subunit 3
MRHIRTHKFHIVDPSPWPILTAIALLIVTIGGVLYMHSQFYGGYFVLFGLFNVVCLLSLWWRDIIRESTFQGHHTKKVQAGLKYGMILFIISEIMFFFSFFWAYFHAGLAPTIQIGCIWPPIGIKVFSPFEVPLLNTLILLLSGATITVVHYSVLLQERIRTFEAFVATILLAILFTCIQVYEYLNAGFAMSDGIYGSVFFMATGFHGFHVIIGSIFIIICMFRFINYHFSKEQHVGLEAAIWYWHFVDVVWLFLYISVYFLGYYNFFL